MTKKTATIPLTTIVGDIALPSLPNYVTVWVAKAHTQVDVSNLSEAQLREMGAKWIESLVAHAKRRKEVLATMPISRRSHE